MGCANTKMTVTTVQVLPEEEDEFGVPDAAKKGCCACGRVLKKCCAPLLCL